MRNKKLVILTMAACMTTGLVAGCGAKSADTATTAETAAESTAAAKNHTSHMMPRLVALKSNTGLPSKRTIKSIASHNATQPLLPMPLKAVVMAHDLGRKPTPMMVATMPMKEKSSSFCLPFIFEDCSLMKERSMFLILLISARKTYLHSRIKTTMEMMARMKLKQV